MAAQFVNQYLQDKDIFYKELAQTKSGTDLFVAGHFENHALFAKTDASGMPVFTHRYESGNNRLGFESIVQTEKGDFLLHGFFEVDEKKRIHVVSRLHTNGKILWSRTYDTGQTFEVVDFVKSGQVDYFMASQGREKDGNREIEILRINDSGNVGAAVRIGTKEDERINGILPYQGGLIAYGGTQVEKDIEGWIIRLDRDLKVQWAYQLGNKAPQEIMGVVPLGKERFALVADEDLDRNTAFTIFRPVPGNIPVRKYKLYDKGRPGPKQLILDGKFFYLLGALTGPDHSRITKLDTAFAVKWNRSLKIETEHLLHHMQIPITAPGELRFCGHLQSKANAGLIAVTDLELQSCLTQEHGYKELERTNYNVREWRPEYLPLKVELGNPDLKQTTTEPKVQELCKGGGGDVRLEGGYVQSPYVYIQAAGSQQIDDSVPGFHLRWIFRRNLGQHLAKGNLSGTTGPYPSTAGFNKDNDYVRIHQMEFQTRYETEIDLNAPVMNLLETGGLRRWTYLISVPLPTDPGNATTVTLDFADRVQYDAIRAGMNPLANPRAFLSAYQGLILLRTPGKRFFCAQFQYPTSFNPASASTQVHLRVESISLPDPLEPSVERLSCRQQFLNLTPASQPEICCEDIEHLRYWATNESPSKIIVITYEDYLLGTGGENPSPWNLIGQYGLSLNDQEVFLRLEDPSKFVVHNSWRKYNEPSGGEFRVNVPNYQARWSLPVDGLKKGVEKYLQLSPADPTATATLPNQDPVANNSAMEVSYLDLLNLVSLDFHVARMLGLGTIDPRPSNYPTQKRHCYLLEYITEGSLEGEPPQTVRHYYMTPPTSVKDFRLPPEPELDLTFGLYADGKNGNPTLLTDPGGYLPYADLRYINLNRAEFRYEKPMETFFQSAELFCLCDESLPLCFGVEYANGSIATGNPFVRPELSNDSNYQDPGGLNEVAALVDTDENTVYVHQSGDAGKNHYGLYSINWFSRVSQTSNLEEVDNQFPLRCPLLPPLNLHCHLIQQESTLILTTAAEQAMLAGLAGDKTLVRATFDWNQVHNQAYQFANKVEFNFRTTEPRMVRGNIQAGATAVVENTAQRRVTVKTTFYDIGSTSAPQIIQPNITAAEKSRFIGSLFVANGTHFVIHDILTSATGNDPTFVLDQIRITHSQPDPNDPDIFCTTETWDKPLPEERFFVYENLDNNLNWDQVLPQQIDTPQFFPVHTETVVYNDGTSEVKQIGGLTDTSTISHIMDPDPGAPANTPTGVYEVLYDTKQLAAHPGAPTTTYYKGSLRVTAVSGDIKVLEVWQIDRVSLSTLKLTVYDATYQADPVIPGGSVSISAATVNFHPGIRTYFTVAGNLNEANTLPSFGQGNRTTFMAARSLDTSNGCTSYLSAPVILIAKEIRPPVPPGVPSGPIFATRPNFYGKATFTFDSEVDRPFSLIYYRANERKILDQLYSQPTVSTILALLEGLPPADAAFRQDRWNDLVNMNLDGGNNFREYVPGGFRFFMPDNPNYFIPHPDPAVQESPFDNGLTLNDSFSYFDPVSGSTVVMSMIDLVKDAINGAFLPLTEIPLVYGQLQDTEFQTSGKPPKIRDTNGERLLPTHPDYDPWPMAFRYEKNGAGNILQSGDPGYGNAANTRFVRFTDYTLDGASTNIYFYFGVELSNTFEVSDRSPVKGPVALVNSEPAESPKIKKLETVLSVASLKTGPGIRFILNDFQDSEGIEKFEIYRATSHQQALSVRTMSLARTVNAGEDLLDDFGDVPFPLYGEPLFYRLVALRKIFNEQGNVEYVPSKPSNLSLTNLVDNVSPPPPVLSIAHDPPAGSPLVIDNVVLNWNKTAHNARYLVYKMNSTGTWIKIHEVAPAVHLNAANISVALIDTDLGVSVLDKEDSDGNTIYHRFRVDAENSSGLINIDQEAISI